MRVTIEHREETSGLNRKDSYVDCTVEFSEEERAIIKARDLYQQYFTVALGPTPPPRATVVIGTAILGVIGAFLIPAGLIASFVSSYGFLFFIGVGLVGLCWIQKQHWDNRSENRVQNITIKYLLDRSKFTVHAENAAYAKRLDDEIREHLSNLKTFIKAATDIPAKQTFEL